MLKDKPAPRSACGQRVAVALGAALIAGLLLLMWAAPADIAGSLAPGWQGSSGPYDALLRDLTLTYQVSREELGRHAWTLLHTMAGTFPETPTAEQQSDMRTFIELFARLYPCRYCARHFTALVRRLPPDVGSRAALSRWLCTAHNVVNLRLHKQAFPCSRVAQAWPGALKGECGCDADLGHKSDEAIEREIETGVQRVLSEPQA